MMHNKLLAALVAATLTVAADGLSDAAASYRQLCADHLAPDGWDPEEDGPWAPAGAPVHSACPRQLDENSFRDHCALNLTPRGWDEDEDGHYAPPSDLALPTCIITFVPSLLDTQAAGRMEILGTVLAAALKSEELPLVYFWAEAGAQPAVEHALHIGAQLPQLALYSPRLHVGSTLALAFTRANVESFVVRATLSQLATRPARVDVGAMLRVEPWDHGDGSAQTCADELDYANVELDSDF
jgi:hypothetical protein